MWKTIHDFENYEINKAGQIKNKTTGMLKRHTLAKNGYYVVVLYKNNKGKTLYIHRLIAEIFIGNPENLPTVNHIDGIKINNSVENLEWTSYGQNNQHAYDAGLKKATPKMLKRAKKLHLASIKKNPFGANRKQVHAINQKGVKTYFPSVEIASKQLGISRSSIDKVLKGKQAQTKGFKFEYTGVLTND